MKQTGGGGGGGEVQMNLNAFKNEVVLSNYELC